MNGGTYTLLVELARPAEITVGALGEREFPAGWYAYTGSALGPGGFARLDRHRAVAAGANDARHWHVDYLLGHPDAAVADDVRTADADAECRVARAIDGERVAGFGASDCGCPSHLLFAPREEPLRRSVRAAHADAAGGETVSGRRP